MIDDNIYTGFEWNKHELTEIPISAISENTLATLNLKKRVNFKVVLTSKCKHELWNLFDKMPYTSFDSCILNILTTDDYRSSANIDKDIISHYLTNCILNTGNYSLCRYSNSIFI